MKRLFRKTQKLIRGTSTAVLVSAGLHITLLLLASGWVVFTVIQNQAAKFVPPPKIEHPKMDLKKLRVKVQENSRPRKATERIVSSRRSVSMPDIQLPKMTGMGSGLGGGGIGGFEIMNDLSQMTLLGGGRSIGNDLEGTLYYLMRDRQGNPNGVTPINSGVNPKFKESLNRFLVNNWSPATLSAYYRSPKKLYASQFMIPPFASALALSKFGVNEDWEAAEFLLHYKGKIASKTGGKFRFWGAGDDMLFVRINGRLVLDGRTGEWWTHEWKAPENWESSSPENRKYFLGIGHAVVGDWFTLEPGVPVVMEVLFGEDQGGRTSCMLNVQQDGVEYKKNRDGMPILPVFKTAPIPTHLIDEIKYTLIPDESDLEGGPIFGVY